ncbi:MAG: YbbR-like domain-containing protein [Flavobacteriaceae bacterium]|nr:YbbR-like domain-containing protein [Flavobacteriaceae bacterium]
MSILKSKLSKLYKSKRVNILALFILLAFLFSFLTKLSKDYTRTIPFNIEMLNIPEEDVILKDSLHFIDVTLTTYGFNLLKYYFVEPKLKVDFRQLTKTPTFYQWTKNNQFQNVVNQFNTNVKINGISPDTINFQYDSYFVKTIPVVLNENVKYATGFDIDETYKLEPDSIKVIGAKTALDSINKIETMLFDLNNINSDINASIKLKMPENNPDVKFSESKVLVSGAVKKFTEGSLFVPIVVTNLPENVNIKYFPKEIEVIFYTSLDNYKEISPNSFRVECDYSKLDAINNKLVPLIKKQPNNVRNLRLGTKSIEFIIL